MKNESKYGIQLSILYAIAWFIDLLDLAILNVALPSISSDFKIDPTQSEWAILSFTLALTMAIPLSSWASHRFGSRQIFISSQWFYIIFSIACGLAQNLSQLIIFRFLTGFAGGLIIPLGMSMLLQAIPANKWVSYAAKINLVSLIAPALGPIIAGYIVSSIGWRYLFFIKLPLSILCVVLSLFWINKSEKETVRPFDWFGFISCSVTLISFLLVFSKIDKGYTYKTISLLFILGSLSCLLFIWIENRNKYPFIQLRLFRNKLFTKGNLIQIAANVIFLGANYIIALYLLIGLKINEIQTGYIMGSITLGMICILPLIPKISRKWGPLPCVVGGLFTLGIGSWLFCFTNPYTPPYIFIIIIFLLGAASVTVQTPNMGTIFCDVDKSDKSNASSVYSLFKQLSASLGIALSTLVLSLGLKGRDITILSQTNSFETLKIFHQVFWVLGSVPIIGLLACIGYNNRYIMQKMRGSVLKDTE